MHGRERGRSSAYWRDDTNHDEHDDHELVPGRISASSRLDRPTATPLASGLIQRKADGDSVRDDADHAIARAGAGSGDPLPGDLRERFEGSLGTDLSSVRIHTGDASRDAAASVAARAYTIGDDIHFAAGEYDPTSTPGQHLIAHEVAHTVQQRGGVATRQNKLAVSEAGDSLEVEADRAADAMVAGAPAAISGGERSIARKGDGKPKKPGEDSSVSVTDKKADKELEIELWGTKITF
jgi:hypothetical protein